MISNRAFGDALRSARANRRAYFLATHPYREKPERLRCFEDWILSEVAIVETRLAVPAA